MVALSLAGYWQGRDVWSILLLLTVFQAAAVTLALHVEFATTCKRQTSLVF